MIYIGSGAQDNPRYYLVKHITVKPIIKHILKIRYTNSHTVTSQTLHLSFQWRAGCWIAESSYSCSLLLQLWPGQGQHLKPRESVATDGLTWGNYD